MTRPFWLLSLAVIVTAVFAFATARPAEAKRSKGEEEKKAAAASAPETWYVKSIARGEGGMLIVNYWSKGQRFRAETVVTGHTIVTIVNGDFYYTLDPVAGKGVKISRSKTALAQEAGRRRPFANELDRLLAEGGEKVGTEEVMGKPLDVYRLTDDSGKREIWVSPGEVPIPFQVKTFHRRNSTSDILNYAGWMVGIEISDDLFEPDPRIVLEEVSYDEYVSRSRVGPVGPAPVLYKHMLHGDVR